MHRSITRRLLAAGVAATMVAGTTLVVAGPALAAPGDASAFGAQAAVTIDVAGVEVTLDETTVGASSVAGSGTDTSPTADYTLIDALLAGIQVNAVTSTSTTGPAGSSANASIASADVDLLGFDILTLSGITAATTCVVGQDATAVAQIASLTVLDETGVDISSGDLVTVDSDLTGDLTGVNVRVEVQEIEDTTATTATATALVARVILNGTVGDVAIVNQLAATITLASAECETPAVVPVTLSSITPNVGPTFGGQTVTIAGTGFGASTTVTFDGIAATDVVPSADGTSLTAVTPANTAGDATVAVSNPGSSATLPYLYVEPSISGISPNEGPNAGGTEVTISGAGLGEATGVTVGGDAADIISISEDGTSIVIETPPGTGLADVVVLFDGDNEVASPEQFLYVDDDSPQVTDLTPTAGPTAGGTTVTITGTDLADVTQVFFGDVEATIVGEPTATRIVVVTPANPAGLTDVVLLTSDDDAERVTDAFLYVAAPASTTITPGSGPTTGGTTVTIGGSGFVPGATTVTICGVTIAAANVTVSADGTSLTFRTPPCAAGNATVTITTPGGTTSTTSFRYVSTAAAGTPGSGTLASTGATPAPIIAIAGILLLLGAAFAAVAVWRRQKRAH
jgi:LPXTG-motif cell wall-anchored protein